MEIFSLDTAPHDRAHQWSAQAESLPPLVVSGAPQLTTYYYIAHTASLAPSCGRPDALEAGSESMEPRAPVTFPKEKLTLRPGWNTEK